MQIGNYEIIKSIGEGGFARTYLGEHKILGEKACLKQNLNITNEDTELFMREAKLMWDIHHYSLPSVRDFFPAGDGSYVLAMSYVPGNDLEKIVTEKGPIHPEDVCWISQRMLGGLQYLHYNGIVHCDVKPQNVIIQPREHNAVLVDYGLSAFRPKGDTKPVGYTPAYVAPELANGNPPTPASDYYGVGLTMIFAFGGNIIDKSCPSGVPDALKDFVDELIRYDPKERPDWEKTDLIERLSDIRLKVFKRKHTR
jgi:serine/threonine protein kinase